MMASKVLNAMARHMTSEGSTAADDASNLRQDLDILLLASGPNGAGIGLPLLPEERFFPFWKWLGQSEPATTLATGLLTRVQEIDGQSDSGTARRNRGMSVAVGAPGKLKSGQRPRDGSEGEGSPGGRKTTPGSDQPLITRSAALNTVLLLALHHQLDTADEALAAVLGTFMHALSKSLDWTDFVVSAVRQGPEGRLKTLGNAVGQCANLLCNSLQGDAAIGCGYIHTWLQSQALKPGLAPTILASLITEAQNVEPGQGPDCLNQGLCLLHIVRQFLSLNVYDDDMLPQLASAVSSLYLWPNPVGHYAAETLHLIAREQRSPGTSLRRRLAAENAALGERVETDEGSKHRRRVTVLLNPTGPRSSVVANLLQTEPGCSGETTPEQTAGMQLRLIVGMLQSAGVDVLNSAEGRARASCLANLPLEMIANAYEACVTIAVEAENNSDVKQAALHRSAKLADVWRMLGEDVEAQRKIGGGDQATEQRLSCLPMQVAALVGKDRPREPVTLDLNACAKALPLQFEVLSAEPRWRSAVTDAVEDEVGSTPGPIIPCYAHTGAEETLLDVIKKYDVAPKGRVYQKQRLEPIRIVLAGGDGSLHYAVAAYVGLLYAGSDGGTTAGGTSCSEMLNAVELRFYVVPCGKSNVLASYIAQEDIWYYANTYLPVQNPLPIIPHVGHITPGSTTARAALPLNRPSSLRPQKSQSSVPPPSGSLTPGSMSPGSFAKRSSPPASFLQPPTPGVLAPGSLSNLSGGYSSQPGGPGSPFQSRPASVAASFSPERFQAARGSSPFSGLSAYPSQQYPTPGGSSPGPTAPPNAKDQPLAPAGVQMVPKAVSVSEENGKLPADKDANESAPAVKQPLRFSQRLPLTRKTKAPGRKSTGRAADGTANGETPVVQFTKQIENLVREAEVPLRISIFNCEGWFKNGKKNQHCTLVFFSRAEIGVSAAVATQGEDKQSASNYQSIPRRASVSLASTAGQEALESLAKTYRMGAKVTLQQVTPFGEESEDVIKQDSKAFSGIVAVNVPRPGEQRLGANPCTESLEVCLVDADARSRRRVRSVDDLLDGSSCYHSNKLVVEASDFAKPFHVLLDGEVYGPFYRIRITPCRSPKNRSEILRFPVMTYLPFAQ